jgi:hypothetical protein
MGGIRRKLMENESKEVAPVNEFKQIENPIEGTSLMASESLKAVAEVQAAMISAKRFPRDRFTAVKNILEDCGRSGLAEGAVYAYPRGGQTVSGPSIRLAEAMARCWGNLDCGVRELSRTDDKSVCEAFAWDLETNTRFTRIFEVPHIRYTKSGSYKLNDPRDIYETIANNGARRLRACILEVIPGDVTENAVLKCKETLTKKGGKPLVDRIQAMIISFSKFGVTQEHIEKRLKHPAAVITEEELFELNSIGASIKGGIAKRGDFFEILDTEPTEKTSALKEKLAAKKPTSKENADLDAEAARQ